MRALTVALITLLFVTIFAGLAFAQLVKPQVADKETGLYKVQVISSGETLYNMHWSYQRVQEGDRTFLLFKLKGDNDTQGSERIDWDEEAKIEETATGLRTLYWEKTSRGAEQMDWHLKYDWAAGKAHYTFHDRANGKKESKALPITKETIPGDALYLILRGFPFAKGVGYKLTGKVLTGGDALTGNIIFRAEEKITTPLGTFDTYKLELKPKGLIGMLPTKLYMWFTKEAPHICLRFDGLEGIHRTKTITYEFSPMP